MGDSKIINVENILDIVDVDFMQNVQDFIAHTMDVGLLSFDSNGALTQPSNWAEFCSISNESGPLARKRCKDCHKKCEKKAVEKGKPIIVKCYAGLTIFCIPVFMDGKHMASVIGGQVLTEPPNEEHFKRNARELNINEEAYVTAVRKLKIVSAEKIKVVADLLQVVMDSVSGFAYANLQLAELGLNYKIPRNIVIEDWLFSNCKKTSSPITAREFKILKLIVLGRNNTEIANELFISVHTVKAEVSSLLEKFCVEDRVQVAVKAVREGLI